jgi:hypothetical protein
MQKFKDPTEFSIPLKFPTLGQTDFPYLHPKKNNKVRPVHLIHIPKAKNSDQKIFPLNLESQPPITPIKPTLAQLSHKPIPKNPLQAPTSKI